MIIQVKNTSWDALPQHVKLLIRQWKSDVWVVCKFHQKFDGLRFYDTLLQNLSVTENLNLRWTTSDGWWFHLRWCWLLVFVILRAFRVASCISVLFLVWTLVLERLWSADVVNQVKQFSKDYGLLWPTWNWAMSRTWNVRLHLAYELARENSNSLIKQNRMSELI